MKESLEIIFSHPVATVFIILAIGWAGAVIIHGDK